MFNFFKYIYFFLFEKKKHEKNEFFKTIFLFMVWSKFIIWSFFNWLVWTKQFTFENFCWILGEFENCEVFNFLKFKLKNVKNIRVFSFFFIEYNFFVSFLFCWNLCVIYWFEIGFGKEVFIVGFCSVVLCWTWFVVFPRDIDVYRSIMWRIGNDDYYNDLDLLCFHCHVEKRSLRKMFRSRFDRCNSVLHFNFS